MTHYRGLLIAFTHEDRTYTTATDAAKYAGVKVQTVYNWLDSGKVQGVRRRTFRFVEVDSLVQLHQPIPSGPA